MYPITNEVKALFESEQRKVLRITGTDKNGATISITDNNVIADSFQIDRYACNGEKLEIGTAIAAQLTLKLENGNGQYDGIVFEGAELFVEVGIADWTQSSPTVTYIPCGYFTPDDQPRRLSTISITALDRMTKFDAVVDGTQITTPITVANLVARVCTLRGVTLAQSITGLTNANVSLPSVPSGNSVTYRNLIAWCAGIMGTNVWFDWNGQLRFSWYNNATGYASTVDNRYSSDMYENDLTVTGVVYTTTGGIDIVEGTDDYALDLTGNTLAAPMITTILPALNTALNGFSYRPFTAAAVNAPYLWPMDAVTFTDKEGNDHASLLTNVCFGLNGTTAMEARGMTYVLNRQKLPEGFTKEQAQLINEVSNQIKEDIDDSLTQQDIFNRLTENGAAQGLVLYNGQLYINASYINAGELVADIIKGGTLTLGGANNVNGTLVVLDASGNVVGSWSSAGITINNGVISIPFTGGSLSIGGDATTPLSVNCSLEGVDYSLQIFGNELRFSDGNNTLGIGPASLTVYQAHSGSGKTPAVYLFGNSGQSAVLNGNEASLRLSDGTNSTYINYEQIETGRIFLSTPLGIPYGGTGANSPAQARTNLEITPANIGAVSTTDVIDIAHGGTGANNKPDAISSLFDAGINQPSQYPNKPGIYRVISNIFSNLTPASYFGILVIFKSAYGWHTFLDSYGNMYYGYSGDTFGEPTTWHRGVIDSEVINVAHGGTGVTQGTIDITDYCAFDTSYGCTFDTGEPYGCRLYYNKYLNCVFGNISVSGSVPNQAPLVTLRDNNGNVLGATSRKQCCGIGSAQFEPNESKFTIQPRLENGIIRSSHYMNLSVNSPKYTFTAFVG